MIVPRLETRMFPRDGRMIEDEVVAFGAADGERSLQIGDARDAEIDVVDLEMIGHFEVQ